MTSMGVCKLMFVVLLRRSRLASTFGGGVTLNGVTEGVSYRTKGHSPSHRPLADDSPLKEGAEDVTQDRTIN